MSLIFQSTKEGIEPATNRHLISYIQSLPLCLGTCAKGITLRLFGESSDVLASINTTQVRSQN